MEGILKIGKTVFSINKSEFRHIEDNGYGSSGWEFDIQTDEAGSLPEDHSLFKETVRFYCEGAAIPIPVQEDLTGVGIFLEGPIDYWKRPIRERLREQFEETFLKKPFGASDQGGFYLYVFEHSELKNLSLKFIERKDDFYKILITAKIPKGAVESYGEDLTIDTWIKQLPSGSHGK